jgi:hypothetical protein
MRSGRDRGKRRLSHPGSGIVELRCAVATTLTLI